MPVVRSIKPWYKSRTIFVNLLALIAMIVQNQTGYVVDAEVQTAILVIANLFLRFDTDSAIK